MKIEFAAVPTTADALVLPVAKGALDAAIASHSGKATLTAAATAARFEGEAGGIVEAFVNEGFPRDFRLLNASGRVHLLLTEKSRNRLAPLTLTSNHRYLIRVRGGTRTAPIGR